MQKTLTATVLSASLVARPTYKGSEGTRRTKGSRADYINSLLGSYADERGEIGDDYAYSIITGRDVIPLSVVDYYRQGTSLCPGRLYDDIKYYLDFPEISHADRRKMLENLYTVLNDIPARDRRKMKNAIATCYSDKDCMLLTCLLYYAWRTDLAQYTYTVA